MLELATAAVALVSPWLAKVGEGAANKIGETAIGKLGSLYDLIKSHFSDADSLILLNLERSPSDPDLQKGVAKALADKMQTNPHLTADVERLINDAKSDPVVAQFVTQVYGGTVGKIINLGTAGDVTIN